GCDPSLDGLAELIRGRTQGNPFFIEELVQALVEAGSLRGERGAYRLGAAGGGGGGAAGRRGGGPGGGARGGGGAEGGAAGGGGGGDRQGLSPAGLRTGRRSAASGTRGCPAQPHRGRVRL